MRLRLTPILLALVLALAACSAGLPSETLVERETPAGLAGLETSLQKRVQGDPEDVPALRLLALTRLRLGKLEAAERAALRATDVDPFDSRALYVLGRVYTAQEKRFRALAAYRLAVQFAPNYLAPYVAYARTQALLGDPQEGLQTLAEALRREPRYYPALYERAHILWRTGRRAEAEAALEQALRIRPRAREALLLQVRLFSEQGRLAAAEERARQVLEKEPQARDFLFELLDVYRQRADWGGVRSVLERLRALGPLSPQEALVEVEMLSGQGRDAQAKAALDRLIHDHPGFAPALVFQGRELIARGQPEPAVKPLNRAIDLAPSSAEAFYWKAVAHFQLGERTAGEAALASAERLAPERPAVRLLRAARLIAERRFGEARNRLDAYLSKRPTDPQALLLKAELLTLAGDFDSATLALDSMAPGDFADNARYARARIDYLRGHYQAALDLTHPLPAEPELAWRTAYLRGSALARLQRPKEALAELTPFLSRPEGQGRFHRLVGYLQLLQGDRAAAERTFQAGLGLFPRNPLLLEGLSRLAMERGDWKRAKALLETGLSQESGYNTLFLERLERVYRQLNEDAQARETLQRFLQAGDPLLHEVRVPVTPGILFGFSFPRYTTPP